MPRAPAPQREPSPELLALVKALARAAAREDDARERDQARDTAA